VGSKVLARFPPKIACQDPKPPNFQIQPRKQHKKKGLPDKNISTQCGILVMPYFVKIEVDWEKAAPAKSRAFAL
jgi:hypothetical protein